MIKKFKLIIILLILIFCCITYREIANASFADFTDDDAKKTTEEMISEQQKNYDATKSNNNFLQTLKVKDYELTPEFDKQTLEYTLNLPSNVKEITVEAKADDDKAKIEGIGVRKITENKTDYRVDVTSESGTVRTYIIKINGSKPKEETKVEENKTETSNVVEAFNSYNNIDNTIDTKKVNTEETNLKYIIIVGIIFVIIVIMIGFRKNKTKAKRRK